MKPLCVISGGTSGIGLAMAKSLIQKHDLVLIFKKNEEQAKAAVEILKSSNPSAKVLTVRAALEIYSEAVRCKTEISSFSEQPVEVLINCAGVSQVSFFLSDSMDQMRACLDNNLYSTLNLTHVLLPGMYAKRKGRILCVSSIAAEGRSTGCLAYGMSKAAIESMTKNLSTEVYGRGLRVNCLRPGLIETPMTTQLLSSVADARKNFMPIESVVAAADFLLSEAAKDISGTILNVDNSKR